jgi:hypothetical protein
MGGAGFFDYGQETGMYPTYEEAVKLIDITDLMHVIFVLILVGSPGTDSAELLDETFLFGSHILGITYE